MIQNYKLQNQWDKTTLLDCMESWITDRSVNSYKALPCYAIRVLWLTRNKSIFEGSEAHLGRLTHQIKLTFGKGKKMLTNKNFKEIFKLQILIFLGHGGFSMVHANDILKPVVRDLFHILANLIFSLLNMEQERVRIAELNFILCGYCLKWLKISR